MGEEAVQEKGESRVTGTRFVNPTTEEEYLLIAARETAFSVHKILCLQKRVRPEELLGECWLEVKKRKVKEPDLGFTTGVIQWVATDVARRLAGRKGRSLINLMNAEVENRTVRQFRVRLKDDDRRKNSAFPCHHHPHDPATDTWNQTPLETWCDYRAARSDMMLSWTTRIILYLHLVEGWTYREVSVYLIGSESGVGHHLIRDLGKPPSEFLRDARGVTEGAESPDGPGGAPAQPAGLDTDRLLLLLPAVEPVPPRV